MAAEHPLTRHRLQHLEKLLGRGTSYTTRERELILSGAVPEWVFRATRLEGELGERSKKAADALEKLFRDVWPKVATPEDDRGH